MQVSAIPMESLAELFSLQMENGGIARLVVTGSSMHPTLRDRRDVVYLSTIDRPLKKKDLILYQRDNGQYILHRIVSKPINDQFICSGDNQWEKEPVRRDQALAIVKKCKRGKKLLTERSFGLRLWVTFWVAIFPLRRPILAARRSVGKLIRKLKYTL